jgi:hypothetical protein
MNQEFRIDFITVDGYEYLAAEISFRNQRLCQLCRTKDRDTIEIKFIEDKRILQTPIEMKFPLADFLEVVEIVRNDLLALKI